MATKRQANLRQNDMKRKDRALKAAAGEINEKWIEVLRSRGILIDPNEWLTEEEIVAIIGRHLTAGDQSDEYSVSSPLGG